LIPASSRAQIAFPATEGAEQKGKFMAHDEPQAGGPSKLVIRNIGLLLSGMMEKPILDADTILAENGRITAVGRAKDIDAEGATTVIDAQGTTVTPGLIDSHVHPVAGDWTPRPIP
jgi:enamidase